MNIIKSIQALIPKEPEPIKIKRETFGGKLTQKQFENIYLKGEIKNDNRN